MSVLTLFDDIQVNASEVMISPIDKLFCEQTKSQYERLVNQLKGYQRGLAELAQGFPDLNPATLTKYRSGSYHVEENRDEREDWTSEHAFSTAYSQLYISETLEKIKPLFIQRIIQYFNTKYNLDFALPSKETEGENLPENTGKMVGVDLGLKTTATYSYSEGRFEGGRHYRKMEAKLASAQRANKKKQAKSIHAKIAACRKDELHKETTRLVKTYDKIFVGDVSSTKLVKTTMAKSVLDTGWGTFRAMLEYKAMRLGVEYKEVKEMFSSVTCSACFTRSGPIGLSDLEVRDWVCQACGVHHDRDENAANNILMTGLGHQTLIKGIS